MVLLRLSMDTVKKEKVRRPLTVTDRLRCMHTCVCVCVCVCVWLDQRQQQHDAGKRTVDNMWNRRRL